MLAAARASARAELICYCARGLQSGWKSMNRRKKINQLLKAHAKKASAKLAPKSNKPKYISKADRLKLAAESTEDLGTPAES